MEINNNKAIKILDEIHNGILVYTYQYNSSPNVIIVNVAILQLIKEYYRYSIEFNRELPYKLFGIELISTDDIPVTTFKIY